jgi:serine protease inhibitor
MVPMMTTNQKFGYAETASAQLLKLEYVTSKMNALIILPKSNEQLQNALNQQNLS